MTEPPFVAMLPLKITGSHYGENLERMRLMLDSFERFLDLEAPLRIFAVCVPAEMTQARAAFGGYERVSLDYISEEDVVPGIGAHRAIGWFKQQALKLGFSRIAPSEFYLTLDPDILLCRELRVSDLVREERCYTSWMKKADHADWWAASAAVLGMTPDPDVRGLNVTPNMLSAYVARALGRYLKERFGAADPWLALLDQTTAEWTEYTLYSVFAEGTGMLDEYHRSDLPGGRRLLGRSVWTAANFENYSLTDIHAAADGAFFTVCASHTMVPAATLRTMFQDLVRQIAA
jgi:hypothetical protein